MNIRYICNNCGGQAIWSVENNQIACENCNSNSFSYEVEDKCPKCSSKILFNDKKSEFYCSSCDFKQVEENIEDLDDKSEFEEDNLGTFESNICTCSSCGAEIIIEPNTVATKCPFCNSNVQVSKNIIGSAKPYGIIPFKQTKEDAIKAFQIWCRKGLITPKEFMVADRIQEIKPVYIPFWIYDIKGLGTLQYHAKKINSYTRGNYNITEIKHYRCYRSIDAYIKDIPCDASEKMDDKLMDLLEPFHLDELKPFNIGYLSGNLTEKYDFSEEELTDRIFQRANKFFEQYAGTSMRNYSSYTVSNNQLKLSKKTAHYILLPVWTISYDFKGKKYTFVMNGQTGKVVGKPPISKPKVFLGGVGIFTILSIMELIIKLF